MTFLVPYRAGYHPSNQYQVFVLRDDIRHDMEKERYHRSLAEKGKYVISAPYKDAWGSGYLITLSKTITLPRTNQVTAVMGTDFPIYYFYHMLIDRYKICSTTDYRCFVIDTSGFIVIHDDFTSRYTDPKLDKLYHITNKEGSIARDLMSKGVLTKRTCTDFQSVKDQLTYRVDLSNTQYKNGIDTLTTGELNGYEMRPVENSNIFILIKKNQAESTPCCTHQPKPSVISCNKDVSICECLCYRDINSKFDFCQNEYISIDASPPCSAAEPVYEGVFKDEETKIKGLQSCFETNCQERNSPTMCYNVAGCSWCSETASGSLTRPPFCALKEVCEFGKCRDDSNCKSGAIPGKDITTTQNTTTEITESNNTAIGIGVGLGCVIVAVLTVMTIVVIIRRRRPKSDDYLTAIDVSPGTGSRPGSSAFINGGNDVTFNTSNNELHHAPPPPYYEQPISHLAVDGGSDNSSHYDKIPSNREPH